MAESVRPIVREIGDGSFLLAAGQWGTVVIAQIPLWQVSRKIVGMAHAKESEKMLGTIVGNGCLGMEKKNADGKHISALKNR